MPAVSVLRILLPSETVFHPRSFSVSISLSSNPPSGPIRMPISLPQPSFRTDFKEASRSASYAAISSSKADVSMSESGIREPTSGMIPRRDCFAASSATRW